jgi:WXG100 family type VII secretion target
MPSDHINYSFAEIESVQAVINQFVQQMNSNLSDVDTKFKNLIADGWHGSGADAFQAQSAKWHQGANNMAQTLQTLAQKVGNASVNMEAADRAAAARFS